MVMCTVMVVHMVMVMYTVIVIYTQLWWCAVMVVCSHGDEQSW